MRKELVLLTLFLLSFPIVYAKITEVDCFSYYKFQEGIAFGDLRVEKAVYNPGDRITVSYGLKSLMEVPIAQGFVRVQILYNDPLIGETIVDEFITEKDINLFFNDEISQEFYWIVPSGASAGEYIVKTYLLVGKSFNLGGLSFLPYGPPGVPGAQTSFKVENPSATSRIFFNKDKTSINGNKYEFASFLPVYNPTDNINVKTVLQSDGPAKSARYSLKTYEWDDVTETTMDQYTVEKTVSFNSNEEKDIEFNLPALKPGTYELKFVAESAGEKSVLKMRFSVAGAKGRFIYLGLDQFPLKQNKQSSIFFCLSNSADYVTSFNGTGTLEVLDENNKQIYKENFGPFEVISSPMGEITSFVPDKTYTKLTLRINLLDANGTLMDNSSIFYDYSKFANVPVVLSIDLNKNTYAQGETLSYSIRYQSDVESALNGNLLIYLLDPDGKIVSTKNAKISGSYQSSMKLPYANGQYTLSVRELARDLKTDKVLSISEATISTGGFGNYTFLIIGVAVIVIVLSFLYFFRGKLR